MLASAFIFDHAASLSRATVLFIVCLFIVLYWGEKRNYKFEEFFQNSSKNLWRGVTKAVNGAGPAIVQFISVRKNANHITLKKLVGSRAVGLRSLLLGPTQSGSCFFTVT
jgi:hypothetical protein